MTVKLLASQHCKAVKQTQPLAHNMCQGGTVFWQEQTDGNRGSRRAVKR